MRALSSFFAISLAACTMACGAGVPQTLERPPLTQQNRELFARINLQKARALEAEGRHEIAASAARRGLEFEPDNAELHRIRADALEALGRAEEARSHRERAEALAPPPPPLPLTPHPLSASGTDVLVVLLPPSATLLEATGTRDRLPKNWQRSEEATTLIDRLAVRLPHAARELVILEDHPAAASVPGTRRWLDEPAMPDALVTLRVDRAFCGNSVKDGRFAIAWLRVGTSVPGSPEAETHLIRVDLPDAPAATCKATAVAGALERALELDSTQRALAAGAAESGSDWSSAALRVVFPSLEGAIQQQIQQGRRYLSLGELTRALDHFERAREIDPEDPVARAFLSDTERSIELARLLGPTEQTAALPEPVPEPLPAVSSEPPPEADDHLASQLSPSQRVGLEAQLAHEQRRREEMLSALAVLYEMRNAPTLGTVANMRRGDVNDPTATGVALALARIAPGAALEVRTLYAPDGSVLARYYFGEQSEAPVLREEDTRGDGQPDRWVAYERGIASEVWESETPGGPPSLHLVYGEGGSPLERVELDHDGDGRLDRLFVYASGLLREESWDTNGDGSFDRFQQFDESGSLTLREEDVDGDEEIDIRTAYRGGRLIRREILNPDVLTEIQ